MTARPPHTPIIRNCGCETQAGIVVAGPDAERLVVAFEADHGPAGCGGQLVHRAESAMGRKVKPKRGGRAA
jgi:hypothetical protein